MHWNRTSALLAICLGAVGIAVCIVIAIGLWYLASRLTTVNDTAFDAIDKALTAVVDRTLDAGKSVQESKITAESIGETLRNRTLDKAAERLSSRLELEEKSKRLLSGIQQADHGLDVAAASMEVLQNALELGGSLGVPLDGSLVASLTDRIATLRAELQEATDTINGISEGVAELAEGDIALERKQQVVQLALRVALSLGEIDSRINSAASALSDTQATAKKVRAKMHSQILFGKTVFLLLIAWMAAGQVALLRQGMKNYQLVRNAS